MTLLQSGIPNRAQSSLKPGELLPIKTEVGLTGVPITFAKLAGSGNLAHGKQANPYCILSLKANSFQSILNIKNNHNHLNNDLKSASRASCIDSRPPVLN
jgi:hypothetical protein